MELRSAALFLLVALFAGCDLLSNDAPSTFEATYRGATSGTLAGSYSYTHQFQRSGLVDVYVVRLGAAPSGQPGGDDSVALMFGGIGVPTGTSHISNVLVSPDASASFAVDGLNYTVTAGTITIAQQRGRLVGSFRFTDSYSIETSAPDSVVMEGRFDVARDD